MPNEPDQNLETLVHHELRQLPELTAPANLIPQVLATLRTRAHQLWWQRPWLAWPKAAQTASAAALFTLLGAIAWFIRYAGDPVDLLEQRLTGTFNPWLPHFDTARTLANAAGNFLPFTSQQLMLYVAIAAVVAYLACVGLGTVLFRVIFQKR